MRGIPFGERLLVASLVRSLWVDTHCWKEIRKEWPFSPKFGFLHKGWNEGKLLEEYYGVERRLCA